MLKNLNKISLFGVHFKCQEQLANIFALIGA